MPTSRVLSSPLGVCQEPGSHHGFLVALRPAHTSLGLSQALSPQAPAMSCGVPQSLPGGRSGFLWLLHCPGIPAPNPSSTSITTPGADRAALLRAEGGTGEVCPSETSVPVTRGGSIRFLCQLCQLWQMIYKHHRKADGPVHRKSERGGQIQTLNFTQSQATQPGRRQLKAASHPL